MRTPRFSVFGKDAHMELIRISSCKLKVMLTAHDVERLHLDPENDEGEELHRSFRLLLQEIKEESGFDAGGNELSIQYFPSREGGCEMFISHLSETDSDALRDAPQMPREIAGFHKEYAFRFPEMEALLAACKRLSTMGYIGESQAYIDEKESCFLFLGILSGHPFEMPEELRFLSEYGRQECVTEAKLYLAEHGTSICSSSAVAILAGCR